MVDYSFERDAYNYFTPLQNTIHIITDVVSNLCGFNSIARSHFCLWCCYFNIYPTSTFNTDHKSIIVCFIYLIYEKVMPYIQLVDIWQIYCLKNQYYCNNHLCVGWQGYIGSKYGIYWFILCNIRVVYVISTFVTY